MSGDQSEAEYLARAILEALDREARKRPYDAAVVVGALGIAAAAITTTAYPANGGIVDGMMLSAIGMGFTEALKAMRVREGN